MPEAATRTAALLAGQVDWIEVPAPDAIPRLQAGRHDHRHQQVSAQLDLPAQHGRGLAVDRHPRAQGGQPRHRPRRPQQAAGRPDDRGQGLRSIPAIPGSARRSFDIKYDPAAAKKLLAEAGYSATKKPKIKIAISTSGSGQMLPLPMNEYVQENLERGRLRRRVRGHGVERAGQLLVPAGDRPRPRPRPASTASTSAAPRSIPTRPSCASTIRASCRRPAPTGAS